MAAFALVYFILVIKRGTAGRVHVNVRKVRVNVAMMPVLEVPPSVVPQMVVCSLSGVWILVIAGRAEQHTLAQVH